MLGPPDDSHDETTPLLESSNLISDATDSESGRKPEEPPLQKGQFAILCSLRMLDPITFNQIFPYINKLITELDFLDDPSQVGFYSGIVESVFAVTQLVSVLSWSLLSDDIGRRPVILAGSAGLAFGTLLFGFSRTYPTIIISRAIVGLFAGNAGVIPSAIGDITTPTNRNTVFPILACFWPLGLIVGPIIGGQLSNPASKFPLFKRSTFFKEYPYVLPCFVVAGYIFVVWLFAFFFLKESRPLSTKAVGQPDGYGSVDLPPKPRNPITKVFSVVRKIFYDQPRSLAKSGREIILDVPMVRALCSSGLCLGFLAVAFDAVFVLFCYSPIETGGLSFPPEKIGLALAVSGVCSAILQAFIMPSLLRRFGPERIYWCCSMSWPFTFALLPFLNLIAQWGQQTDSHGARTAVCLWIGIAFVLCFVRVGNAALILNTLIIANHLPDRLGTGNGLLQMCVSLTRVFGPAAASSLFTVSKRHHLLGGHLWAILLVLAGIGSAIAGKNVDKLKNSKKSDDRRE